MDGNVVILLLNEYERDVVTNKIETLLATILTNNNYHKIAASFSLATFNWNDRRKTIAVY